MPFVRERLIQVVKHEGVTYPALERLSGIAVGTWKQMGSGKQRATEDAIEFVAQKWPQYAYWLVTGKTDEAHGHISPGQETTK